MGTEELKAQFKGLKVDESKDINILLLGETGVGKSTFINAIANYLHYKNFKKASKEELLILIPALITLTNQNFEQITIQVGSDNNEYQEVGAAGTQDVKTYVFPIGEGKTRLRLIDSPGMGDPRGIEQDDINCENILVYLSQLKELHAICFLMRPTNTRKTILFEYCVKEILSRLEKSASNNIIFIFTNTRGANYTPGETMPLLKDIVNGIKAGPQRVDIPLSSANTFSLDNEAFRYLVAVKHNVTFADDIRQRFIESWNKSSEECWRLICYIIGDASRDGLKPHQLYNTISINEARRVIGQLSKPLADISQLIYDNVRILERHKSNLRMTNQSLDELKKQMYIPVVNLEVTQLTQPVTVCTSPKCADLLNIGEVKKWHYRQRCHDPCHLTNVTKEIIGDPNLMNCAAMSGRTCQRCTCDFSLHMHIYYMTKTVDGKIVDDIVINNIHQKEAGLREAQRLIGEIDKRKSELEMEREVIIKSTAQFAHFLKHNAITPFNDSYKTYIEYLVKREQGLGRNGDQEVVNQLEQLLQRYNEIKAAFDNSLQLNEHFGLDTNTPSSVSPKSVMQTIHLLYQLKHNGKKIHQLFKTQKASRSVEYEKNCEYIHPKTTGFQDKNKSSKQKKQGSNATDDEQRKKDTGTKKKSDKGTDSDSKGKTKVSSSQRGRSYFNSNQNRNNPYFRTNSASDRERDLPPPYPGHEGPRRFSGQIDPPRHGFDHDPNVVVKVELSRGEQRKNYSPTGYPEPHKSEERHYDHPYRGPHQGQYHGPPQGQYHGPPQGQYYGPPPGQYYGPPQGQYYDRPPQDPYHRPPQAPYHGGPPHDPYWAPPHYNAPPSGNYHRPSQEFHQGPPQSRYDGNSERFAGEPLRNQQQRSYQKAQGRGSANRRGRGGVGGPRSHSQGRVNKNKGSGNDRKNVSSSESSSD